MRNIFLVLVITALGIGGTLYYRAGGPEAAAATSSSGGGGGRGGRGGPRQPMTVDTAVVTRHEIVDYVTVVGNLIGQATVDVVPRIAGRIEALTVQLGDQVSKGQEIARIEDREIRQQISQADAGLAVNAANVAQRQNDVKVRETVLNRQRDLFSQGLTSQHP
jgi:multidrug efflux pump subunit AcrA (membrane-fusion protein)